MKKLMIAAAAAAMVGGAYAEAQVLAWDLTLKTTTCKEGKVAAKTWWVNGLDGYEKGDEVSYRTSASVKLKGVTWGCYCGDTLNGIWNERDVVVNKAGDTVTVYDGITFWNPKTDGFLGGVYNGSMFDWGDPSFLNRIGKKCDEVEMCFNLIPSDDATEDNWGFTLAGFGKVKDVYNAKNDDWCDSYLKSAKGSVVGFMSPDEGSFTCLYCDQYGTDCEVFDFCDCEQEWGSDDSKTVAFGTWKVSYNSSASKKLRTKLRITDSYSGFTKEIKAALVAAGE